MNTTTNPMALAAIAATLVNDGIRFVIGVAVRAMRLGSVPSVKRLAGFASLRVHAGSYWLEMFAPDASLVGTTAITNVIDGHAFRNRADFGFVNPAVSLNRLPVEPEDAIAVSVNMAYPDDFAVRSTRVGLRPEAFFGAEEPSIVRSRQGELLAMVQTWLMPSYTIIAGYV